MNEHQIFNELKKILTDKSLKKIQESIIYKESDGSVVLFDKYTIVSENNGVLIKKNGNELITLSTLQIAVTYCTFEKKNMINQLLDIERLDRKLTDSTIKYQVHKRLAENSKSSEDRALYLTKMQEDFSKRRRTKEYLNIYINQARHYQQKIFESLA
jgi:DNA polymerase III delta prime subunit